MRSPFRSFLLLDLCGVIIVLVFALVAPTLAGDPGLGWHLKTGEIIANTSVIPHSDPFLAMSAQAPWVCNQWLSDLILYRLLNAGGWAFLSCVCFSLLLSTVFLVTAPEALEKHYTAVGATAAIFIAAMITSVQWFIRPVIFSFFLFAVLCVLARNIETKKINRRAAIGCSAGLFILWANLHPAFILGLVVLLVYAVTNAHELRVTYLSAFAAGLIASLVNPYGFGLHQAAFGLVSDPYFMDLMVEWHSPNFHEELVLPLLVCFGALLFGKQFCGNKLTAPMLLSALFAALSLKAVRYMPFFGIAVAPILCASIDSIYKAALARLNAFKFTLASVDERFYPRFTSWALAILVISSLVTGKVGVTPGEQINLDHWFPEAAVTALLAEHPRGRILHSPNWGGYLTYRGWPETKASIDDRNEVNGRKRYEDYLAVAKLGTQWHEILERDQYSAALVGPDEPITQMLRQIGWIERFRSDRAVVLVKPTTVS